MVDERFRQVWVFATRLRRGGSDDYAVYLRYISKSAKDMKVRRYAELQLSQIDRKRSSA